MSFRSGFGVCQTCNFVGTLPEPAKQAQHVSIGRMAKAGPSASVQVRAAKQRFSVGLPLILPCDAQNLLDSGSGDALMRYTNLVEAVRDSRFDLVCSSTGEIPWRFALALALLSCRIRIVARAPSTKDLGRSHARASARSHAISHWF